jgi:hypothetical protein
VTATVNVVEAPFWTVRLLGVADSEKSPIELTTSVTTAVCEAGPLLPLIVSG